MAVFALAGLPGSLAIADPLPVFANSNLEIYFKDLPALTEKKVKTNKEKDPTTTVTGDVDNGGPAVLFTMDLPVEAANGFAQIGKGNGNTAEFFSLTFEVPGYTFGDLLFDTHGLPDPKLKVKKGEVAPPPVSNDVTISAYLANVILGTYSQSGLGTGEQSWLVLALTGTVFDKIVVTSIAGFTKMDHFEVSELKAVTPVPIPAALPLFAGGLGLMGWMARRRRGQGADA